MDQKMSPQQMTLAGLAVILWLLTLGLGMNGIYQIKEIFYLVFSSLGGNMRNAEQYALILVFLLGASFTVFVIGSAEYHRKYVGTEKSWRLFTWSLAIEASIILLYYIL
jgi:membrane protease YdiL (CAAX protease family)